MLHQELRKARKQAKLTQGKLAELAGIPRQQVVRAERGDNITLETLRSIAAHLPVTHLTLLENVQLVADFLPQPAKIHFAAMDTVGLMVDAVRAALNLALQTRLAMQDALDREPLRVAAGLGPTPDEDIAVLRDLDAWVRGLGEVRNNMRAEQTARTSGSEGPNLGSEDPNLDSEDPNLDSENPNLDSEDPKLGSEDRKLGSEDRKLDSEDRKLGFEDRKLGSEDRKLDSEDRKLDSEGPELDSEGPKTDS